MSVPGILQNQRPRELRRRVMLRVRMRSGAAWSDACVLNISSRGLMINAPICVGPVVGSTIEVRHGGYAIVGEVVWRTGTRAGLRSVHRVPVDEILATSSDRSFQLTAASQWPGVERRKAARRSEDSRLQGRAIEFVGVIALAVLFGLVALSLAREALAKPMTAVSAALGG